MNGQQQQPLWKIPIPVIGLTGEFSSGKTLFGLTIDPASTLIYDTEKSSQSYGSLGFARVDVVEDMRARFPGGYKPVQTFESWRDHVRRIRPGQYRVIVLDTVSEIESGLADWVEHHPEEFGHTKGQYANMSGLMWGDVKAYWKALLSDIASRCESFVFCSHMASVWQGNKPLHGKRKPKGKETLMELASLYLLMERKPDANGNVPDKPAATVLKSRLAATHVSPETGDVAVVAILPPRLPVATPFAVRRYMDQPPDYTKLKEEERVVEEVMSEDERASMRLATAEADREAEQLRTARLEKATGVVQAKAAPAHQQTAAANGTHPPPTPSPTAEPPVNDAQLGRIRILKGHLFAHLGVTDPEKQREGWAKILAKRGVKSAKELTFAQADDLLNNIAAKVPGSDADGNAPPF